MGKVTVAVWDCRGPAPPPAAQGAIGVVRKAEIHSALIHTTAPPPPHPNLLLFFGFSNSPN